MRIAIDIREASTTKRTGKGQWAYGFTKELLLRNADVTVLGNDTPLPSSWSEPTSEKHFTAGRLWHLHALQFLRQKKFDLYISPTSYIIPAIDSSIQSVPIVHDLIAFRPEPHQAYARFIEKMTASQALKNAFCLCTVSDATRNDLLQTFPHLTPSKISTIFAGPAKERVEKNIPDQKTILCLGTLCPRKNQLRLIKAYNALPENLRDQYRLLLVGGRGWQDSEIVQLAQSSEGVEWRGYVDDAEYDRLLSTCTVFALPSLYEGFGMQILDALQRGVPILTSDRGSLAEVVDHNAVIVDPEDIHAMTHGLERLLGDDELRAALAKRGPLQAETFSWKRTVDLFLYSIQ